ncbi:unnamed protein product [Caenorhabditis angaria]|uniref:Digestive organ expansion factor homolog n=1 Tax=Caenorhabditis angaria TaxID=860376 RepID=A0A9P1IJP4_9PELO|nr:unnamed protein product [Caenorhabditis angaria]
MAAILKKKKAKSSDSEPPAKIQKLENVPDNFEKFLAKNLDSIGAAKLQDIKNRTKTAKKVEIKGIGASSIYEGLDEIEIPTTSSNLDLAETGWNSNLIANMTNILAETEVDQKKVKDIEDSRSSTIDIVSRYIDLLEISDDQDGYRSIYCAHIISHLIKNRNTIIANKRKLEIDEASEDGASEELIESCRDSGFVRPVVLILCPFKKDAYDIIQKISSIIYGDEKGEIWNKKRFEDEYSGPEEIPQSRVEYPPDHLELLKGNNDDAFRIGIALSKKVLKLYEKFDKADILLCSPLGLRMILNGDDGNESHLLSSTNIIIVDRADQMLQQNWENIQLIFSQLFGQPAKIDVDISRVRKMYLDGYARHFSQILLFSRFSHELFTSLMVQNSGNHNGLIVARPKQEGTLKNIEIPLCQEIHKFQVTDPNEVSEARFKYFVDKIVTSLTPRTVIVIPSYYDFVRIRNHFKKGEESFVSCHEYAPRKKVDRAREMFFHERKSYLLVTERWYFFNRRQLTGVHRAVFYQLPSHPLFYSEFINMSDSDTKQRFLAVLLVCKFDRLRMENTFGTEMAQAILSNKQQVQAIVSE